MTQTIPSGYPAASAEAMALICGRDKLSIDDMRVMSLIEAAGETFYRRLSAVLTNPEAQALLEHNANEERHHAERLLKAVELLGGGHTPVTEAADNPYVKPFQVPAAMVNSPAFFDALVKAEDDSVGTYARWAGNEANEEVATLLRLNSREEGLHARRLTRVKELLA